jgi:hypothetical protein
MSGSVSLIDRLLPAIAPKALAFVWGWSRAVLFPEEFQTDDCVAQALTLACLVVKDTSRLECLFQKKDAAVPRLYVQIPVAV